MQRPLITDVGTARPGESEDEAVTSATVRRESPFAIRALLDDMPILEQGSAELSGGADWGEGESDPPGVNIREGSGEEEDDDERTIIRGPSPGPATTRELPERLSGRVDSGDHANHLQTGTAETGDAPDQANQGDQAEQATRTEQAEQAEQTNQANQAEEEDQGGDDDGYDSDGFSAGSTSAGPSVRDFTYENGWRYHRFREGSYNFPNDEVEQEREDMKHAMVKLMCGQKLHFAPIGDNPQEILDIGTGTGIWSIEMGDQFPSAHVLGIDLSPIQPDWLPPNVRFLVDDVESTWLHPRNHFDYIHSRHTVVAIRDWPHLFHQAVEHLKPGGWIELQEVHHCPHTAHPDLPMPTDHPVARFWALVESGLAALGVDNAVVAEGRLAEMMREAGLANVTERVLHIPIGTWARNRLLKTVGLYWRTILLDGLQAIGLGPLTRGLKWSRDEVELFLVDVRRSYYDDALLMYMPFHIIYAQKPL